VPRSGKQEPLALQWESVPQGKVEADSYVNTDGWGTQVQPVPFAIVTWNSARMTMMVIGADAILGNLERGRGARGNARHGREIPDACEIG